MKGRSVHIELSKNKVNLEIYHVSLNLAKLADDCSGCYTIPGIVQCAMHSVTTSYWVKNFHIWQLSIFPTVTIVAIFQPCPQAHSQFFNIEKIREPGDKASHFCYSNYKLYHMEYRILVKLHVSTMHQPAQESVRILFLLILPLYLCDLYYAPSLHTLLVVHLLGKIKML